MNTRDQMLKHVNLSLQNLTMKNEFQWWNNAVVFNLFEVKDTRNPVQVDKKHIVQHDISDSQFSVCVC